MPPKKKPKPAPKKRAAINTNLGYRSAGMLLNKEDTRDRREPFVGQKTGRGNAPKPREDDPGWKWYKQGNKTAGSAYAKANPPPKGYKVTPTKRAGVVRAVQPMPAKQQAKLHPDVFPKRNYAPLTKKKKGK